MVATAELLMHKDCWHATVLEENGLRSVTIKLHELKIELHYAPNRIPRNLLSRTQSE